MRHYSGVRQWLPQWSPVAETGSTRVIPTPARPWTGRQRDVLGKLMELLPYLGRADSVCEARLLSRDESDESPDETWWQPSAEGVGTIRLLAPAQPVRRAPLELGTVAMRKGRRTLPPETTWVTYRRRSRSLPAARSGGTTDVDGVRFAVLSIAPLASASGVLLADEVHRLVTRALDGGRADVFGHDGATTDHQHAHWVPLAGGPSSATRVESLLIWVPATLTQSEIAKIMVPRLLRGISGQRGGGNGYEVKGLPTVDLLLQGAGPVRAVAPELCGPARRWRSLTPYLPVRHHKPRRESLEEFLATDACMELAYRRMPAATGVSLDDSLPDRWAMGFRRYRLRERLGSARQGVGLRLEFDQEVAGPLLLGQLSHFGYGIFIPE